jgi:hypothetical protein
LAFPCGGSSADGQINLTTPRVGFAYAPPLTRIRELKGPLREECFDEGP